MKNTDLTIVVLIKDTPDYIRRWLLWAQHNHTDYSILIADGSCDDACAEIIQSFATSGLHIQYRKSEPDTNRTVFYTKIIQALQAVSTPYVMIVAPDDFLWFPGVHSALRELKSAPSASSARGRVHDFECRPDPSSLWADDVLWRWYEMDEDLSTLDAGKRLFKHLSEYCLTYHDVMRTETACEIFSLQLDLKIFDPNLNELFLSALLVVAGPIIRIDTPYLFRASRPNSISATMSRTIDPFDEFFQHGWMEQYHTILDRLVADISKYFTDPPVDTIRGYIHTCFRHFYAPHVIRVLAPNTTPTRFKIAWEGMTRPYQPLPNPPDELHASVANKIALFLHHLKSLPA